EHNPLNNVSIKADGKDLPGAHIIKGVIYGNGQDPHFAPGDNDTPIIVEEGSDGSQSVDVKITASLENAESEGLVWQLSLSGVPDGVTVFDESGEPITAADGAYVLKDAQIEVLEDGTVIAKVSLNVPEGTDSFTLNAEATAVPEGSEPEDSPSGSTSKEVHYGGSNGSDPDEDEDGTGSSESEDLGLSALLSEEEADFLEIDPALLSSQDLRGQSSDSALVNSGTERLDDVALEELISDEDLQIPGLESTQGSGAVAIRKNDADDDEVVSGPTQEEIDQARSEEHTSELQSRFDLVCRLLLE